jgi:hypothetical protein
MEKISNFMRATKKRKALESEVVKPPLPVEKTTRSKTTPPVSSASLATLKKPKPAPEEETDADGELYENGIHVPAFVYATVKYTRKNARHTVDETTQRVVAFIEVRTQRDPS